MKFLYRFFIILILIVALISLGLKITGNGFLIRGVWITYLHGETSATIDDLKFFDSEEIKASNKPLKWVVSDDLNKTILSDELRTSLDKTQSVAFLVLKNDQIIHEEYWDGYSDSSLSNSFSMAKSITTMLVQIAIQKGHIKSWGEQLVTFLPKLKGTHKQKLQLKHLSNMSAGLDWNEHYTNPFDITAKTYYGRNIENLFLKEVGVESVPGKSFEYQSGATQYLGLALETATGRSISDLASEWLWQPMGANHNAKWRLDDSNGKALTFCCFNSNARDFARFGKLLDNKGNWEGSQLLDSNFVQMATNPQMTNYYGYSFWLDNQDFDTPVFYMRGILGQYIIVVPEENIVIVRLGHQRMANASGTNHPQDFITMTSEVLKQF